MQKTKKQSDRGTLDHWLVESSWYPARDPQNPHVSLPNWAWDLSPRSSQESYQEKTPCVTVLLPAQLKIQAAQAFSSLDLAQQAWFPMASPADHSKCASTQLEMLTAWRRRDVSSLSSCHTLSDQTTAATAATAVFIHDFVTRWSFCLPLVRSLFLCWALGCSFSPFHGIDTFQPGTTQKARAALQAQGCRKDSE